LLVYKTENGYPSQSPVWNKIEISYDKFAKCDPNTKIICTCWDFYDTGNHKKLGECNFKIFDL